MKTILSELVPSSMERGRIALEIECSPGHLEAISCGVRHPSRKLAERLAEALNRRGFEVKAEEIILGRQIEASNADHRLSLARVELDAARRHLDRMEEILAGAA